MIALPFIFNFFLGNEIEGYILVPILFYLIYIVLHLGTLIVMSAFSDRVPDFTDYHFIFTGLLTIRYKRIYYSELGYFYLSDFDSASDFIDVRTMEIYEQGFLHMKKVTNVAYDGDLESLKRNIKSKLQDHYKEQIKRQKRKAEIDNWSGCVDKQSERDDKLNKILNK